MLGSWSTLNLQEKIVFADESKREMSFCFHISKMSFWANFTKINYGENLKKRVTAKIHPSKLTVARLQSHMMNCSFIM